MSEPELSGPLFQEGELVEIAEVRGEVEVLETECGGNPDVFILSGATVAPNGKHGQVVSYVEDTEQCIVHTFDGLLLRVAEENLRSWQPKSPEEGGFDAAWPAGPATYELFAQQFTEALWKRGFCVVHASRGHAARTAFVRAALERGDYGLPREEFEEELLGSGASSKISPIAEGEAEEASESPLGPYVQLLRSLAWVVGLSVGQAFGYMPWQTLAGAMVRMPLAGRLEREQLRPEPVDASVAKSGEVERHLDLLQRRRLCLLYMVHNRGGGYVDLAPRVEGKDEEAWRPVRLPIREDCVLVFCHDQLRYSYRPSGSEDAALQAWMLEEPQALQLRSFEGSQRAFEGIVGGPELTVDRQVHIMSAFARIPGKGHHIDKAWCVVGSGTSTMLEIPLERFDMSLYYTDDPANGKDGRSLSKHSGLLDTSEWVQFDNDFFGVTRDVAAVMVPCHRVLLETAFETLHLSGFALSESLRGAPISAYVGDCSSDCDTFHGFSSTYYREGDPESWLQSTPVVTSATRMMHILGLCGACKSIDTACSSSLVATNLLHAQLLAEGPEGRVTTGLALSSQNLLQPWGWIGLSAAGMVGPAGRVLWADEGANGMTRGEGAGGLCLRVSRSIQATLDRICVISASFVNQDGRSASLTAPNGPSQQKCVRSALRDGHVSHADLAYMETHGTGTALGDPIEIGSCRAIFLKRFNPVLITTAKSHLAHLEGAAGMANLLKLTNSLLHASVAPNCHLRQLNSHIEMEGFPVHFPLEVADMASERNMAGTNAFGFGGTNSHADLWAACRRGPRKLPSRFHRMAELDCIMVSCSKCSGRMCWLCGVAVPKRVQTEERHRCAAVRQEPRSYGVCSRCYGGEYVCGEEAVPLPEELGEEEED